MLAGSPLYPTIPARDLDRARAFYEGVLGLPVIRDKGFELIFRAGDVEVDVYASDGAGTARHTLAAFIVEDIETVCAGGQVARGATSLSFAHMRGTDTLRDNIGVVWLRAQ